MFSCNLVCTPNCITNLSYWLILKREQHHLRDLHERMLDGDLLSRVITKTIEDKMHFYEIDHIESAKLMNYSLFVAVNLKIWGIANRILSHTESKKITLGNLVYTLSEAILNQRKDIVATIVQTHAKKIRSRDMRRALLFIFPNLETGSKVEEHAFYGQILEIKRQRISRVAASIFDEP